MNVRRMQVSGATVKQKRSIRCRPNRFTRIITGMLPATLPNVRAPVITPRDFSLKCKSVRYRLKRKKNSPKPRSKKKAAEKNFQKLRLNCKAKDRTRSEERRV